MADYQLTATPAAVIRTADQAYIPSDPNNRDWQAYEEWRHDGGIPDPYVAPPEPEPQPDALAEAQRANDRLDAGVQAAQDSAAEAERLRTAPRETIPDPVTQEQLAALQTQVDTLQQAVVAMLQAQAVTPP